jgi:hypothetical protein
MPVKEGVFGNGSGGRGGEEIYWEEELDRNRQNGNVKYYF